MAILDSVLNATGGIMGGIKILLFYILPVIAVGVIIFIYYQNKAIYKFKIRFYRIREDGKFKESNHKAGYIGRRNSTPFFRIKIGKMWWQRIDLITTPKVSSADLDDRFYYLQKDVGTFIQLDRKVSPEGLFFTPIEGQDIRYAAVLKGKRIKSILNTEATWKKVLPYIALVLLSTMYVAAYIIALKAV